MVTTAERVPTKDERGHATDLAEAHALVRGTALEGERQALVRMSADSGRNWGLFLAGCRLGKYVHHGVLSLGELEDRLLGACTGNGLIKEDGLPACKATLVSGLRKAEGDDLPVLEDRGPPGGTAQAERAASEGASTAQKARARGNGHDANAEGDDAKKEGEQKQAATDPDLVEMNDKFAVVKVGGKKDENGDERKIG